MYLRCTSPHSADKDQRFREILLGQDRNHGRICYNITTGARTTQRTRTKYILTESNSRSTFSTMSGHGYAHGQPPANYSPPPLYLTTTYNANGPPGAAYPFSGNVTQSFEYNRNVIPGLSLGLSNGSTEGQQAQVASRPASHDRFLAQGAPNVWPGSREALVNLPAAAGEPAQLDDGELSEGELEDIYEPQYTEDTVAAVNDGAELQMPPVAAVESSDVTARIPLELAQQHQSKSANLRYYHPMRTNMRTKAYDRTGSYSPYLSAHEIDEGEVAETETPEQDQTYSITTAKPPVESVAQARKRALDAISHLWPLDVRYQDYIKEGIDGAVIDELFHELGLRDHVTENRSQPVIPSQDLPTIVTSEDQTKESHPAAGVSPGLVPELTTEISKTAKNPAEERKDRIARLLAAKGSKQAAVPPDSVAHSTSNSTSTPSAAPTKPQSEKSKLLQQKMEALKRAREARAQKIDPDEASNTVDSNPSVGFGAAIAEHSSIQQATPPDVGGSEPHKHELPDIQSKRPAPVDSPDPSEGPSKRPFGQSRQSQPFLIDVSDDEDDEAMDLDSPELRPTSVHRPSSPFKITPYRDLHTAPNPQLTRQVSSPIATPPISHAGKGNLENMNKEIELMKRKIAEAEARKRIKPSTPGSPAVDHVNSSRAASISSNLPCQANNPSPQPHVDEQRATARSRTLQEAKGRNASRSRSRAASDRLPIVEAHRKEQLLRLQALQSQVRRMEREIEESMREEEMLRKEAVDDTSSDEYEVKSVHEAQVSGKPQPDHPWRSEIRRLKGWAGETPESFDQKSKDDALYDKSLALERSIEAPGANIGTIEADGSDIARSAEDGPSLHVTQPDVTELSHRQAEQADHEPQLEAQSVVDEESSGTNEDRCRDEEGEVSADNEPSLVESSAQATSSEPTPDPAPGLEATLMDGSDEDVQMVSTTTPITQPISIGKQESKPASPREVDKAWPYHLAWISNMQTGCLVSTPAGCTQCTQLELHCL